MSAIEASAEIRPADLHISIFGQLAAAQLPLGDALEAAPLEVVGFHALLGGGPLWEQALEDAPTADAFAAAPVWVRRRAPHRLLNRGFEAELIEDSAILESPCVRSGRRYPLDTAP